MKPSTKRSIAISCLTLALGCALMAAGWGMGGSLSNGRNISIGGTNGVRLNSEGLFIGGSNGVYVGPYGISVGGRNGIYVGPAGIRIGPSGGAYAEVEQTTDLIDQAWIFSGTGYEVGTAIQEDDGAVIQNIEVEPFDRIQANIDLGDITVLQHGDSYFVEFQSNIEDYYKLSYSFDGSTLVIGSEGEQKAHWGTVNANATVTIIVPVGKGLKDIDLHSDLGDIYVGKFEQTLPKATLKTNLGNVTWENSRIKELSANSDLGDVTVILPDLENVGYELSTSLGEVMVDNDFVNKEKASRHPKDMESYVQANSDLGNVYLGAAS